jgi:uncharacterized protein with HEPN domain
MREELRDRGRLLHIIEAIDNIIEFTEGKTFKIFQQDKILQFAIIKNLEIIGEAAYMVTADFKTKHGSVDWAAIVGMRHMLVHGYYQIRNEIIWATIETDLLPLREIIKEWLSVK